jgi:hypothetical protein
MEVPHSNAQQGTNQELRKVTNRHSKLQRNCPKIKNEDFLWN